MTRKPQRWKPDEALALAIATLCVFGILLTLFNGCASIPPPGGSPIGEPFKPVKAVGKIPPQPGDEIKVEVSVGQLRESLLVAEEYDALIPFVNEQFAFANEVAKSHDRILAYAKSLYLRSQAQKIMATGLGIGGGILIGAGISLILMR